MFNVTYPPTDPEPCPCTMLALKLRPHPNLEPAAARALSNLMRFRRSLCGGDGRRVRGAGTSSGGFKADPYIKSRVAVHYMLGINHNE